MYKLTYIGGTSPLGEFQKFLEEANKNGYEIICFTEDRNGGYTLVYKTKN